MLTLTRRNAILGAIAVIPAIAANKPAQSRVYFESPITEPNNIALKYLTKYRDVDHRYDFKAISYNVHDAVLCWVRYPIESFLETARIIKFDPSAFKDVTLFHTIQASDLQHRVMLTNVASVSDTDGMYALYTNRPDSAPVDMLEMPTLETFEKSRSVMTDVLPYPSVVEI